MRIYILTFISAVVVLIAHLIGMHGAYASVYTDFVSILYAYDTFVHFLGGLTIGFGAVLLTVMFPVLRSKRTLCMVITTVIAIGIAWEVFEVVTGIAVVSGQPYWPDTIKDIVMDTLGGCAAWLIARKNV